MTSAARRRSPYQGLISYDEQDAPFFFGREKETRLIIANLFAAPLTLLFGASGVGKSSVLRAGVAHQLRQHYDLLVAVFHSWQSDPISGLKAAIAEAATRAGENCIQPMESSSLAEHLTACATGLDRHLIIILDQFEEYFLYHPQEDEFTDEFSSAVRQAEAPISFLISIREDSLAKLDRFEGRIPSLFDSYMRIEHLDHKAAKAAIEGPLEEYNRLRENEEQQIGIEPELVEEVLKQVETGKVILGEIGRGVVKSQAESKIETPYLQLVMTRLWDEEMRASSNKLQLKTLNKLHGARSIVQTHLDATMDALPEKEKSVAASVFNFLVTPSGTKIAHTVRDLAQYARLPQSQLAPVLEELSKRDVRILKPIDSPPDQPTSDRYEIFHDVLAPAILAWRAQYVQAQERAEAESRAAAEAAQQEKQAAALRELAQAQALAREQSQRAEAELMRAEVQAKAVRYFRLLVTMLLLIGLSVSAILVTWLIQKIKESPVRSSQLLAAQSISLLDSQPDLAMLLSIEAHQMSASFDASNSLLRGLTHSPKIVAFLHGHQQPVNSLAFSPDGKMIASVSFKKDESSAGANNQTPNDSETDTRSTNYIILWDVETRRQIKTFEGHPDRIISLAFSPDGKILASGTDDYNIILWDVNSGTRLGENLVGEDESMTNLAFSPDGNILAAGTDDGFITLWGIASRKQIANLMQESDIVKGLVFSPDGKTLASGGLNIILWDTSTWKRIKKISTNAPSITDLAFSPDGRMLVSSNYDEPPSPESLIIVWDPATGKKINSQALGSDPVNSVAFCKDGKTLAAGSHKRVILWDVTTNLSISLNGHIGLVNKIAFGGPSGNILASAGEDKRVILWDVSALSPLATPLSDFDQEQVYSVAFSAKREIVGIGSFEKGVTLWDVKNGKVKWSRNLNAVVYSIDFSQDDKKLAAGTRDGLVLLDVETGAQLGETLKRHDGRVSCVKFSPDGKLLASGGRDNKVILWDIASGKPLFQSVDGHTNWVTSLAFSPDGTLLASGSGDKNIIVWNVTTGKMRQILSGHKDQVTGIAFTLNGKSLMSCSKDKSIIMWNISSGQSKLLALHDAPLLSLALSPDGGMLATGDDDNSVTLWGFIHEEEGVINKLGPPLTGHYNAISSVAFSPDGKILASGSEGNKAIILWDLDLASWRERACRMSNRNLNPDEWTIYLGRSKPYGKTCIDMPGSP